MAMEVDPRQAIPVDSVAQEYCILAGQTCPCGGHFRPVRQALLHDQGRYYDLLEAVCQQCGAQRRFLFDIHTFFGQLSAGAADTAE